MLGIIVVIGGRMSKGKLKYHVPLNLLIEDDGTKQALIAINYFRGNGGSYAEPSRDALREYVQRFRDGLSESQRKQFDEILATVKTTEAYRKRVKADG